MVLLNAESAETMPGATALLPAVSLKNCFSAGRGGLEFSKNLHLETLVAEDAPRDQKEAMGTTAPGPNTTIARQTGRSNSRRILRTDCPNRTSNVLSSPLDRR